MARDRRLLPCRLSGAKPPIRWKRDADGRAECPACHKRVRLTNRGRLWPHGATAPAPELVELETKVRAKLNGGKIR